MYLGLSTHTPSYHAVVLMNKGVNRRQILCDVFCANERRTYVGYMAERYPTWMALWAWVLIS